MHAAGAPNPMQQAQVVNQRQTIQNNQQSLSQVLGDMMQLADELGPFMAKFRETATKDQPQQLQQSRQDALVQQQKDLQQTQIQKQDQANAQLGQGKDAPKGMDAQSSIAGYMAALMMEDEVDPAKRAAKQKELETKLAMIESMEPAFNVPGLPADIREIIEKFYNNLRRVKEQKKRYDKLEEMEAFHVERRKKAKKQGKSHGKKSS